MKISQMYRSALIVTMILILRSRSTLYIAHEQRSSIDKQKILCIGVPAFISAMQIEPSSTAIPSLPALYPPVQARTGFWDANAAEATSHPRSSLASRNRRTNPRPARSWQ